MTDYAKHIALATRQQAARGNMPTITWQNEKQR